MCLELITENCKKKLGRFSRRKILCIKDVCSFKNGKLSTYFLGTPLKVGKWMSDKARYILQTSRKMDLPSLYAVDKEHKLLYITGYHAYIINKKLVMNPPPVSSQRLVILTDIVAIGRQWDNTVAVGRKMFVVPKRDEHSVIAQWNKRHPNEKISL